MLQSGQIPGRERRPGEKMFSVEFQNITLGMITEEYLAGMMTRPEIPYSGVEGRSWLQNKNKFKISLSYTRPRPFLGWGWEKIGMKERSRSREGRAIKLSH